MGNMRKIVTAIKAKKDFDALLSLSSQIRSSVVIKHPDLSPVIMMPLEEFEGWVEAVEVLSDSEIGMDIREALKEKNRGDVVMLEELKKSFGFK